MVCTDDMVVVSASETRADTPLLTHGHDGHKVQEEAVYVIPVIFYCAWRSGSFILQFYNTGPVNKATSNFMSH